VAYQAFDLSGKVVLITGGNSGIGLGMAQAVAAAGADVCIWGTSESKNSAALAQLATSGVKTRALICDVADKTAVDRAFAETLAYFGRVDVCFANAGVTARVASFFAITPEEWRRVTGVNLDGAFYTLQAAAAHMVERAKTGDAGGRLVVTSSLASISGAARNEHYAATKGAVVAMIKALAVELARYGVTANAILPGWIATAMTENIFAVDKFHDAVLPRVPMRRWGEPADFGGIAVYLSSDASAYHTGDSFLIDGGYFLF
jgi:NAD(P)-dependent dehydrogenase (short-subunit alcohol dehydrogenase family)